MPKESLRLRTNLCGEITAVRIDPKKFRLHALERIIEYSIFRADPVEISIIWNKNNIVLKPALFLEARDMGNDNRIDFIKKAAGMIKRADEVIIEKPQIPEG